MIRFFFAQPRTGKTAAMVAIGGISNMYGENAIHALEEANAEVAMLNENGFNVTPPHSDHLVYVSDNMESGIDVISPDFGHRRSLVLYPDRLGIATDGFEPQFVYRGSTLLIDEIADYADSRNWGEFLEGMCRYWAKHGKHRINMYATCHSPDQVEKRIRIHAMITEVLKMELVCDKYGEVIKTVWRFKNWDRYGDWERKKEPWQETYEYNGDIREAYDTYDGEEEFYIGLDKSDFSCEYSKRIKFTPHSIAEYAKNHPLKIKKKERNQ